MPRHPFPGGIEIDSGCPISSTACAPMRAEGAAISAPGRPLILGNKEGGVSVNFLFWELDGALGAARRAALLVLGTPTQSAPLAV